MELLSVCFLGTFQPRKGISVLTLLSDGSILLLMSPFWDYFIFYYRTFDAYLSRSSYCWVHSSTHVVFAYWCDCSTRPVVGSTEARASTKPLQVYARHPRVVAATSHPTNTSVPIVGPTEPVLPDLDISIALHKDKRSTTTHPISHFVSLNCLIPVFRAFISSLTSVSVPYTYQETRQDLS